MCDGGGSNGSRFHIVKEDFMNLADRLGINIVMVHYPPYCSKHNPIEYILFSQVHRMWQGEPLVNLQNAADRAARTTTKTGLKVDVAIDTRTYETNRIVAHDYLQRREEQIKFIDDFYPQWNYIISPRKTRQIVPS